MIRSRILRRLSESLACAIFAFLIAPCACVAVEPWADARLGVRDGIAVWLDAAAQKAARKARNELELAAGDQTATWYDGSGHNRHLQSLDPLSQPAIRLAGSHGFLRFDGEADYLSLSGINASFNELTVFIVAAPESNQGEFRALLSMNAADQHDYTSGLNIDQGAYASPAFDTINIEGSGAGGARNLRSAASPFLHFQRICATCAAGPQGIVLYVNGNREGARERQAAPMHANQLVVGARYYGAPLAVRGFFAGEIAEVLIFDRVLSESERREVDEYLAAKFRDVPPIAPPASVAGAKPLAYVPDPPPVQIFVPGFSANELPLELPNINNVLYRHDGKLVALAYNGNVYLLSDSDGNGLEDQAKIYWENKGQVRSPIGMDLTPPDYHAGTGVFITTKMKCLLLVDSDGDDVADKEITVAEGWQETFHNVDALGMAVDPRDGSIYFGLGTQNFADAYVVGEDGKARYRLDGERSTIQRVSPDFKSRQTVATGIRFPVAIRINKEGDLFCTDQEGATWLPNGNPFDELLHIDLARKRHYGFPPRHPRHLPNVVDEPSVFDYGPQHQSTCGLNFNEPVNGGPVFGPAWWCGDAIVTGYSRGKLYRTSLVKTRAGYVARNQLVGSLKSLVADACVGPEGELVVATHSGGPDWGSGPSGIGRLYKIIYSNREAPLPVMAWARTPHEVRIAFDRPLDPAFIASVQGKTSIDSGRFVAAGDRFEHLRPGYAAVGRQVNTPRFDVKVVGQTLTPDRRTIVLSTAPHRAAVNYAITLPRLADVALKTSKRALPLIPQTDLAYDLTGVEATWHPSSVDVPWHGWIPHLDLTVARRFTSPIADHERLWHLMESSGMLTLRTTLDLRQMLRPEVQPGSKIDFEYPPEETTIELQSNCPMNVSVNGAAVETAQVDGRWTANFSRASSSSETFHRLEVSLRRESQSPPLSLTVSYHTNEDSSPRTLPLRRMLMPWAIPTDEPQVVIDNRSLAELEGGNWLRGKDVFFGEKAMCGKCHQMRGEGVLLGPDLSNLPQRDYDSVLRDITKPSYAINPDFITHTVITTGGRVLTGSIRSDGSDLFIGDKDAKETRVARDEVEEIHPSSVSVMPEGLAEAIGPEAMRDLLTFLLVEPPSMPDYGPRPPPPPRSSEEVKILLSGADPKQSTRSLRIVLVAGRKDHGPGEHDYPAWQTVWQRLLSMAGETTVSTANDWPSQDDLKAADVFVFYQQGTWTSERAKDIDQFLARGGGIVYIHYAVDGGSDAPGFAERIGLAWRGGASKFRHGDLEINFSPAGDHPIARNLDRVSFYDESYWNLVGDVRQIRILASGMEDGAAQPLFWTAENGKGRVFVSIPGHFAWTFDDPIFRALLLRGIAWSAGESVDRFNDLVAPGARLRMVKPERERSAQ